MIKLSDIYALFQQNLKRNDEAITGVSIDSRSIKPGELFIAISGEQYDGHDFIEAALKKGAALALVSQSFENSAPFFEHLIQVKDTQKALQELARWYRDSLTMPVAALTGSCGKTTAKEMTAAILHEKQPVFSTPGNKNNHLGVPLSILACDEHYQAAIFELGANHVGEIRENVALVKPDAALITCIGAAHIGEFGGIDAIFSAKSEIFEGLNSNGWAIYNTNDAFASQWKTLLSGRKTLTFGTQSHADIFADNIRCNELMYPQFDLHTPLGNIAIELSVPGKHNVTNALAATAICIALQNKLTISLEDIAGGLKKYTGFPGRMMLKQGIHGARIIDDTYNANLTSVSAAIDTLAHFKGKRILVLGDIGELGSWAIEHHRSIGIKANEAKLDGLFTCGTWSQHASDAFHGLRQHFPDTQTLVEQLKGYLDSHTTIVVKGSRSSHMENVVSAITQSTSS